MKNEAALFFIVGIIKSMLRLYLGLRKKWETDSNMTYLKRMEADLFWSFRGVMKKLSESAEPEYPEQPYPVQDYT